MARELIFNITEDRRRLVEPTNVEGFEITFDRDIISGSKNWVDGRIGEDAARQVFVNVKYGPNNEPYDLTGIIPEFCGLTAKGGPENRNYSIIDNWHSVMIDAQGGRFRFDFPKDAFVVAGSYKQAFFNLKREGSGDVVATLEFDMRVMSNFVYSNIVPKDFITPYIEVLDRLINEFKQGNVQKEELISELQKTVQNKLDIIEATFKSTNDTLESLKATANYLSDKIKQDGLFTQGEAEEFKNSVKELAENLKTEVKESLVDRTHESSIATSYNGADKYGASIDLVNSLKADLKIALMSDNHFMYQIDKDGGNSANRFKEFAEISDKVDADIIIVNGDSIDGTTADWYNDFNDWQHKDIGLATNETAINLLEGYKKTQTPVFWILGNHDHLVRRNSGYNTPKSTLSNTEMKELYHTNNVYNEVRDNGSFYFYKDFEDRKIRIIGLNSEDSTDELNSDGTWKNKDINIHLMQQRQLDWLANTALKVDDDWHVVIFYHTPVNNAFRVQGNLINSEVLKKIISDFVNGKSEVITTTGDYPVNVTTNFSKTGNLVGIFNGHYHKDAMDRDTIVGVTMVCQDSATPANHNDRTGNNENAFDILCIDRNSKNVKMIRFGGGRNQEFTY